MRQMFAPLWLASASPSHTKAESKGSRWPSLGSVAPLLFMKLQKRKNILNVASLTEIDRG